MNSGEKAQELAPSALLSKQMGESRTHNQSNREIRFCNCRQVLPVKSGVRSLERLKPGMAAGLGPRAAYSEPRHCSRRSCALILRPKIERERCSRERQEVAIESRTDLPNISKEIGLEDG